MTQPLDIGRIVNSTVEPLNDIARSNTWRRIEEGISAPAPASTRPWWRRPALVGISLASLTAAAALVALGVGSSSPQEGPRTEIALTAEAGERIDRSWNGAELELYGPGSAEIALDGDGVTARVTEGLLVLRRDAKVAVAFSLQTPTLRTEVNGEVVAVRVHVGTTAFATSEAEVAAMVKRHNLDLRPALADSPTEPVDSQLSTDAVPEESPSVATPDPPRRTRRPARRLAEPGENDPEPSDEEAVVSETDEASRDAGPPGLQEVYRAAEAALVRGNTREAKRLLHQIAKDDRQGKLAAAARYDLALLAFEHEQYDEARRLLEQIIESGCEPNLKQPARRLRCRIAKAQGKTCGD